MAKQASKMLAANPMAQRAGPNVIVMEMIEHQMERPTMPDPPMISIIAITLIDRRMLITAFP
jgi:hypothetical protein